MELSFAPAGFDDPTVRQLTDAAVAEPNSHYMTDERSLCFELTL